MTDPTLWAFVIVENTDTQQNDTVLNSDTGAKEERSSIIITIVCTTLAFIFGIICGLITDCCVCVLVKRKAEQQGTVSLQIENNYHLSGKGAHYEMGANDEASAVYDEVTPHYYKTGISNMHMELSENAAYGQI